MASGGSDGEPFRTNPNKTHNHCKSTSQHVTALDVVEETEDVFRSYVFFRYQSEREERGELPDDPEITEMHQPADSTPALVGRQLAVIGDDINRRYDLEFQNLLSRLPLNAQNAYDYFRKIADGLFESGINWGRVIALLGFGYRMAIYVFQNGMKGFLSQIAKFIAEFLLKNSIAQWIAMQGGWVAALELDNIYVKWMLGILAVVLLGVFVVHKFYKS
ncbi:bcl-2 homologous antagonist/killer-like [Pristis pectinata]|uniref:bcl-2 homologous antagonist/killer-like n=1 Tax=Pristis pectinata TaxID=685728 RepID=UPI00223D602F|nr:bcl-2 homologous antagonist/killer-like [Pristis pectinata]XP_051890975.1 bcl-2 homologous antagonist/killer-like [Pristis pectinata]XP_051890976.1 bcl-2 homologous antagonist/killer-like [Pristis pectinata]XP_051890977.1 bcl-2 homologous antagonist/killer-like [Pristis pectinata]